MFRISDNGLVKIFVLVLQHDKKTHIEFQVTRVKVKVIMTHKQTIIFNAIAMNVFNVNTYTSDLTVDEKRELHVKLRVERSKVNITATFWVNLYSDRISYM